MINHCDWCRDHLRQPGLLRRRGRRPLEELVFEDGLESEGAGAEVMVRGGLRDDQAPAVHLGVDLQRLRMPLRNE